MDGGKIFFSDKANNYSLRTKYVKQLNNPITAVNLSDLTLQWLFDIITDSRADLEKDRDGYRITSPSVNDLELLSISRHNAEDIMSAILDEEIIFRMGNRSLGSHRFSILRKRMELNWFQHLMHYLQGNLHYLTCLLQLFVMRIQMTLI